MPTPLPPCSILILAGGRGARMGGQDKGLLEWHGKPLIAWMHAVARPLSDNLIISCNRNQEQYAPFADQLVADAESNFPGPLAGILSGLANAKHESVLILPCDAPLIDQKLLDEMRLSASQSPARPLVLHKNDQWEPMFSVLPKSIYPQLLRAWHRGERSPRRLFIDSDAIAYDIDENDPRAANFNTPEALQRAAQGT